MKCFLICEALFAGCAAVLGLRGGVLISKARLDHRANLFGLPAMPPTALRKRDWQRTQDPKLINSNTNSNKAQHDAKRNERYRTPSVALGKSGEETRAKIGPSVHAGNFGAMGNMKEPLCRPCVSETENNISIRFQ